MNAYTPRPYQRKAVDFLTRRLFVEDAPGAGLLLDPGLGKTSSTLQAVTDLRGLGELRSTLIVAPLRVAYITWPAEIEKWGFELTTSIVHGSPNQRIRALRKKADLYLINPEGIPWLADQDWTGFDLLVVDESTKFKSFMAQRMRAMKKLIKRIPKRVILTGTPTPHSLADMFAQQYILDEGATLGTTLGSFRARFCREKKVLGRYAKWEFCDSEKERLYELIDPWVLRLSAEDHLDMPDKIEVDVWVDLPSDAARGYERLEKELLLELDSGETLTASNAGALYAHCRGVANGGGYERDEFGTKATVHVHDAKAAAVAELHEELHGKPLLVFYQFHHDAERLLKFFPDAPVIRGGQRPEDTDALINRWNAGEIPILLAQPASMAHGLNMQTGGHDIAWVGLPDSLETYIQANARIWRQGVAGSVRVHRILARGTVDEVILGRLQDKDATQKSLLDSLRDYGRRK